MRASRRKNPRIADPNVSRSLSLTWTRFVKSSARPPAKANNPQTTAIDARSTADSGAPSPRIMRTLATKPKNIAMPPMRGVGAIWNFCGPAPGRS